MSAKIPGRIQSLLVEEGQQVAAGQLIAVIESDDLAAAHAAAEATVASNQQKLNETIETERQTQGETSSQVVNAQALVRAAQGCPCPGAGEPGQAAKADTVRIVALAKQGIMSAQSSDEAQASLNAGSGCRGISEGKTLPLLKLSLRQARAHELQAVAAGRTVASTRDQVQNSQALARQASVEIGYSKVFAPVTGKVNVWAARQGEVVGTGTPIVTIMDLSQTWVYAPLPETQADAVVQLSAISCV